jgi:hypothetical protein
MGIDASLIFNTAINLNNGTIKKYLIEEQKNSKYSPQVFFGLLLSHTKKISISKEIEYLNGKVLELTYDLKIFDEEVAPTLSDLSREYNRTKKTKKLEEAKAKVTNYKLFDEIVNRLSKQSESPTPLENKFNTLDIEEVIKHFKPLTTKKVKNEPWMTDKDFDIFIRRSFCKEKDLSKPKIKIFNGKKYAVVTLFYKFYELCYGENITENNKKEPFLILLKEAFETTAFDNVIRSNFKVKHKYPWN